VTVQVDVTPPMLMCPDKVTVRSLETLAVDYVVMATDAIDPMPTLQVSPPSGSLFPTGTTPVEATAVDFSGNQATCIFEVDVLPPQSDGGTNIVMAPKTPGCASAPGPLLLLGLALLLLRVRRSKKLLLALITLSGCFDHSVPSGTVISCKRDDDCPPDHACSAVGQCRSALQPFSATPTVVPARGRAGQLFVIDLSLNDTALNTPLIRVLKPDGSIVATVSDVSQTSAMSYEARYTATGMEPEGTLQVLADIDLKGRSLHLLELGSITLDFTSPQLLQHSLAYQPAPDNALVKLGSGASVHALGGRTTMELKASLSEPPLGIPAAFATSSDGGNRIDFELTGTADPNSYTYTLGLPMDRVVPDDTFSVTISARDLVGNSASMSAGTFRTLISTPPAPDVDTAGAIIFSRAPYGTLDSSAAVFTLEGRAAATPGEGVLEAFSGAAPVAVINTDSDGGFPPTALALDNDVATVDVRFFDPAGNGSAHATVRHVRYVSIGAIDAGPGSVGVGPIPTFWVERSAFGAGATNGLVGNGLATYTARGLPSERGLAPLLDGEPRAMVRCFYDYVNPYATESRWPQTTYSFGGTNSITQYGSGWLPDSGVPPGRYGHVYEMDAWRGAAVLFGGIGDAGLLGDTWELSEGQWAQSPSVGPSARSGAAMVFDPPHHALVLFGGSSQLDGGGELSDTWLLLDGGWVPVMTNSGPSPRTRAHLMYDRKRQRTVLFGGSYQNVPIGDVWAFDGQQWHDLDAGIDAGANNLLCINPMTGEAALGGLTFNGTAWEQPYQLGLEPTPRMNPNAAWDPVRKEVIMFGGNPWDVYCDCDGCYSEILQPPFTDTWAWNGASWRKLDGGIVPGADAGFTNVQNMAMGYDPSQQQMLLFGGQRLSFPFGLSNNLWALRSDETWAPVNAGGAVVPGNSSAALHWSPALDGMVLAGGSNTLSWLLQGNSWSPLGNGPTVGANTTMAWSAELQMLLFHSYSGTSGLSGSGVWTQLALSNEFYGFGSLDSDAARSLVYFWSSGAGAFLDASGWQGFNVPYGDGVAAVFDPERHVLVGIGGGSPGYVATTKIVSAEIGGPAIYVSAAFPAFPSGASVDRAAIDALVGGTGFDDTMTKPGAELRFELEGFWDFLPGLTSTTSGSAQSPDHIMVPIEGQMVTRLMHRAPARLEMLVRPMTGNGRAGFGRAAVKNVMVSVDVTLAPPTP
jgi:hypothetical protein